MWNLRKEVQVYCWGSVPLQSGRYKEILLYRPKHPPLPISPLSPTPKATTRKAFKHFSPEEMCVAGSSATASLLWNQKKREGKKK